MDFHSRSGQSKKKSNRKRALDVGGQGSSEAARKIKIHNTFVNDDKIDNANDNDNTPDDHHHDYDNYPQAELEAAETLLFMSRKKLDVEDATSLLRVMRVEETKNRGHHHDQKKPRSSKLPKKHPVLNQEDHDQIHDHDEAHHDLLQQQQELPQFGYQFDGTKLPKFPPVNCLEGLIENCSTPFVKQLTNTDLSRAQNRLSLNKEDVKKAIIPVLNLLNYSSDELAKGITVSVYDSEGRKYEMSFKTWVGEKVYVLNTKGWKSFVEDRRLIGLRDWMTVWVFKHTTSGKLCFALDINRFPTTKPIIKKRLPGSGVKIAD